MCFSVADLCVMVFLHESGLSLKGNLYKMMKIQKTFDILRRTLYYIGNLFVYLSLPVKKKRPERA